VTASIGRDIPDHESREAEDAKENGANQVVQETAAPYRFTKAELKGIYEALGEPMPPVKFSDAQLEPFRVFNLLFRVKEQF